MFIHQCPVEEHEKIVLALTAIAAALTRPQNGQVVTGQGHSNWFF